MTALSDLLIQRTSATILATVFAEMTTLGVSVQGLQTESILRALPDIVSRMIASGEAARYATVQGGSVTGAETLTGAMAGYLDILGEDFFQLPREAAVATRGVKRITATAAASSSTIGVGKLIIGSGSGAAQVRFKNTEPFAPVSGSYVDVPMEAEVAGVSGNIATSASGLKLITAYPGLSATNPAVTGTATWITRRGRDPESQKSYATRIRARWADLGPQTTQERFAALVAAAFTSAELTPTITRIYVDDTNPLGPGSVALYLATDSGPASADEVALVLAYVTPRWAAGAGPLAVYAASVLEIAVSGTITGPTNEDTAVDEATAALEALAALYPIGGSVAYLEQRRAAIMAGVTGALNVVLSGQDETIPPGSIVEFTPVDLEVV